MKYGLTLDKHVEEYPHPEAIHIADEAGNTGVSGGFPGSGKMRLERSLV